MTDKHQDFSDGFGDEILAPWHQRSTRKGLTHGPVHSLHTQPPYPSAQIHCREACQSLFLVGGNQILKTLRIYAQMCNISNLPLPVLHIKKYTLSHSVPFHSLSPIYICGVPLLFKSTCQDVNTRIRSGSMHTQGAVIQEHKKMQWSSV